MSVKSPFSLYMDDNTVQHSSTGCTENDCDLDTNQFIRLFNTVCSSLRVSTTGTECKLFLTVFCIYTLCLVHRLVSVVTIMNATIS